MLLKVPVSYPWGATRPNHLRSFPMRYLTATAASYAGVDLHATSLHLCVLDQAGTVRLSRKLKAQPQPFLDALAPFRPDVLIGCECVHTWYWLADTCRDQNLRFELGHAWAMKAIHQSKTKSDAHDAEGIARLLRGGNFPLAYAYPRERARPSATYCGTQHLSLVLAARRAVRSHPHHPTPNTTSTPLSATSSTSPSAPDATAGVHRPAPACRGSPGAALTTPRPPRRRDPTPGAATSRCAAAEHFPSELAVLQTIPGVGPDHLDDHPVGDRHHHPVRHPPAVLQLCPAHPARARESDGKVVGLGNAPATPGSGGRFSEAAILCSAQEG